MQWYHFEVLSGTEWLNSLIYYNRCRINIKLYLILSFSLGEKASRVTKRTDLSSL